MAMIERGVWVTEGTKRGQEEKMMFQASVSAIEKVTVSFSIMRNVEFKDRQVWIQYEAIEKRN